MPRPDATGHGMRGLRCPHVDRHARGAGGPARQRPRRGRGAARDARAPSGPGVTTGELDAVAARDLRRAGARSAPQLDYGFPGTTCISVNDEAVHGIPARGGCARASWSSSTSPPSSTASTPTRACRCGVGRARPATTAWPPPRATRCGRPCGRPGRRAAERDRRRGRARGPAPRLHRVRRAHRPRDRPPHPRAADVPNVYDPALTEPLTDGLVITIEPIIAAGRRRRQARDGWTVRTADGSLSRTPSTPS